MSDGGGNKKLILVGLMMGLVGGAAGGFVLFKNFGDPSAQNATQAGSEEAEEEKIDRTDLVGVKLERLAMPIYRTRNDRRQFVGNYFVDLSLMVLGDNDAVTVRRHLPQLRHAFLAAVAREDMMRADSPIEIDQEKISRTFKVLANEVIGDLVVHEVTVDNALRVSG